MDLLGLPCETSYEDSIKMLLGSAPPKLGVGGRDIEERSTTKTDAYTPLHLPFIYL
jgi:hypothetical protein